MDEKTAEEMLNVLLAIRAESQGFDGFSQYTAARAAAVIGRATGQIDGLAEQAVEEIKAKTGVR